MNSLFRYSVEEKMPIDLMYMNNAGEITYRSIIVRKISADRIFAFDLAKKQLRTFKQANILSAAKRGTRKGVNYA